MKPKNPSPTTSLLTKLSKEVGELLQSYKMMLATAESCTGGWVAEMITAIPGSSAWFERGFVTYSDAAKKEMLKVKKKTLLNAGAVSQEVALEMAEGALTQSLAQFSVSITGIAGPQGGSLEKPVGTVWIAWGAKGSGCIAQSFEFIGNREAIRRQAVCAALKGLLSLLTISDLSSSIAILPPVITLDGPGGTGKGTLSQLIAKRLGWHYLDSGALFRILACAALEKNISLTDEDALETLAKVLDFSFVDNATSEIHVFLKEENISAKIRTEECGNAASKIAVLPGVRQTLLMRQRAFRKWPGLVTDGRDMGTVVFPDAGLKFFLYASPTERVKRRFEQLKRKGMHATLPAILQDLEERDQRDQDRGVAPLKPAPDAFFIDTTELNIDASFAAVMRHIASVFHPNH